MTREQLEALKVDLSDSVNWAPTTRVLVLQMFEEYSSQRALIEQQAKEIERLQAQLATANERVTRMRSLLQRAQSIIALDADLYTIWREDAVEELAK